jgi:serine/threonine-protein kinase
LEVDPRSALAYAGLGQAYWRKYELTGAASWAAPARAACEGALGIDSGIAEPHACLGMVLNGTGEYEKAAQAFNRALDLEPTNDLAYLGLATAYERLRRHDDAEQTYRRAIELRPHYWASYNNLGVYYYRAGRYEDALAMFQQVVALVPDSFRGYSSVGAVQFMRDRTSEAIAAFQHSLAIRPNLAAASNLGTLYYFEGQFRLAADTFRQALSFDQNSYQVWANLAQTLEQAGDKEEAAAAFKRARELAMERLAVNSRNAALHIAVAEHSAALGEIDKAKVSLSTALALAPNDAHTLFQIGVFYESRLKVRDEALKWLSRAVERGQTWREIDRAPELRALRTDPRFQQLRRSR